MYYGTRSNRSHGLRNSGRLREVHGGRESHVPLYWMAGEGKRPSWTLVEHRFGHLLGQHPLSRKPPKVDAKPAPICPRSIALMAASRTRPAQFFDTGSLHVAPRAAQLRVNSALRRVRGVHIPSSLIHMHDRARQEPRYPIAIKHLSSYDSTFPLPRKTHFWGLIKQFSSPTSYKSKPRSPYGADIRYLHMYYFHLHSTHSQVHRSQDPHWTSHLCFVFPASKMSARCSAH
jgi:hypothetical protein